MRPMSVREMDALCGRTCFPPSAGGHLFSRHCAACGMSPRLQRHQRPRPRLTQREDLASTLQYV
jgi:hypothetical protein